MATCLLLDQQIEIPLVRSLEEFRAWALSDEFPEQGRIDDIAGRVEVDMSPRDFFLHGTLKTEVVAGLHEIVKRKALGYLVSDRTRVSCPQAELSVEPDVAFISEEALASGRVRLVPKASGEADRYVEVEGPPDVVVEIVSDSSVTKDTKRLPAAYFQAGVHGYWLVDARGESLRFQIHRRGSSGFEPVAAEG